MMLVLALATLAAVQQPRAVPPPTGIGWQPAVPVQGSLVVVSAADAIAGRMAGEPLHFVGGQALAAVPLGAEDSVRVEIVYIALDGVIESRSARMPVAELRVPGERIRAAARFTPPPDSALQVRIDRERALSRDAARRAHSVPRLWSTSFIRPRDSRVTSTFGTGRIVNGVWRSRHYGLDLDGNTGDPVIVTNRGVVALVGDFFYGGRSVYVHHGAGLMTVYQHLSRILVQVGDTLERGQVVGRVGATGRVTGPHLHWGGQYGAISFDPRDLLTLSPPKPLSPD